MVRKASRQSRRYRCGLPPLTLRLVTWQRMSFSDPLVCRGISARSSTISSSGLLALSRASRRSSVTKPVWRPKTRSKRARSAALRGLVGRNAYSWSIGLLRDFSELAAQN